MASLLKCWAAKRNGRVPPKNKQVIFYCSLAKYLVKFNNSLSHTMEMNCFPTQHWNKLGNSSIMNDKSSIWCRVPDGKCTRMAGAPSRDWWNETEISGARLLWRSTRFGIVLPIGSASCPPFWGLRLATDATKTTASRPAARAISPIPAVAIAATAGTGRPAARAFSAALIVASAGFVATGQSSRRPAARTFWEAQVAGSAAIAGTGRSNGQSTARAFSVAPVVASEVIAATGQRHRRPAVPSFSAARVAASAAIGTNDRRPNWRWCRPATQVLLRVGTSDRDAICWRFRPRWPPPCPRRAAPTSPSSAAVVDPYLQSMQLDCCRSVAGCLALRSTDASPQP